MPIIYDIETDYLYKRGREKGIQEVKEETAIRCLEQGLGYSVISRITEFTEAEIKTIDENRN